ncbi:MAG: T9SS type A sorting domain-containing protein [Sphingobacteriales bacterium]|nr:T9SS type A sorting domain-containing protein [Sphingobacteriales bacterium]
MRSLLLLPALVIIVINLAFSQSPASNPYGVDLDNSNDYVSIPHDNSLSLTNTFTISFWVYPRNVSANVPFIRKRQSSGYTPTNYAIDLGSSGQLRFFLYDNTNTARGILTGGPTLTANTWYHITGVFDKNLGSDNFKLYLNGELVKTATWTGTVLTDTYPLIIGYNHSHATNAIIDEVSIWKIALTQTQIQARMYQILDQDDPQYPNLVGYWRFDEGTGTTTDDVVNGLDGTLMNGATWNNNVAPVAYTDHALYFNGVNQYVDFSSPASLNITSAITLEAWIKPRSFGNNEAIIDKLKDISPQGGYNLSVMGTKKVSFKMHLASGAFELQSISTLDTGIWYHISATYDGTTAKIYINGVLDNSSSVSSSIASNTEKIYVGYDDADTSRHFHGYISEVRIWNTALTADDISNRMVIKWINETDAKWSFLQAYWKFDTGKGIKAYDGSKNENTGTLINSPVWVPVNISFDLTWQGYSEEFHDPNNWLPKMVPNALTNCIVPARNFDPEVTVNSTCRNLIIQPDAAVVIKINKTLTVKGDVTINSSTNYTGYLVAYGTLQVDGVCYFNRYLTANGWHYVSSPVNNGNSNTFLGSALYTYNEPTASWTKIGSNTTLTNFKGYDVYYKNTNKTVTFSGTFNSGSYSASLTRVTDGFNFMGNPYPATIDWDATQGWTKINVNNAIYIWDASINNYCEYVNGVNNNCVGRYIPPTMAFWVQCNNAGGGTLGISPTVQHNSAASFRNDGNDKEKEYLKIKVIGTDYSDETSIVLDNSASTDFDGEFDALKIMNPVLNMPDVYTLSTDNKEISINSLPFNQTMTLPLYVKIGISGPVTIRADVQKLLTDKYVLLEDLFLNKIHDFRTGDYLFEGNIGDNPNRFKIHILQNQSINDNTTGFKEQKDLPVVYAHQSAIYVNTNDENYHVSVIDLNGKTILNKNNLNGFSVIHTDLPQGIYFVTINNNNGNYTSKVLLK